MDETMTIWYEVTDKKYAQALRDAADCLEKTGYAKLYLENVTIPGDGSVNDPTIGRTVRGGVAGVDGPGYSQYAQGSASGTSWAVGAAGGGGVGFVPQGATGGAGGVTGCSHEWRGHAHTGKTTPPESA